MDSVFPICQRAGELLQKCAVRKHTVHGCCRLLGQLVHIGAAALQTIERHEGVLPLARIRADRFAEFRLRTDDIEHVIADLKRQTKRLGILRRGRALLRVSAAELERELERTNGEIAAVLRRLREEARHAAGQESPLRALDPKSIPDKEEPI